MKPYPVKDGYNRMETDSHQHSGMRVENETEYREIMYEIRCLRQSGRKWYVKRPKEADICPFCGEPLDIEKRGSL